MAVTLDHTIVSARNKEETAQFLAEILNLPEPVSWGHFAIVQVGELSIDFVDTKDAIQSRHFAFKVSEEEFDEIFARIKSKKLQYWADPSKNRPNEINTRDGGRGFYFYDPNGHFLEVLTRSYKIS
ncbi:MAG: VOC family protein [Gammaproteobacteria bacterium]|nr:VOC family protein [Gammaproteobacteria bacterium]MYI77758.1 VOC family protein [Gammaproteobacteria bacterium]